jgi:drug/metabolite transporter (DMT)-like permease
LKLQNDTIVESNGFESGEQDNFGLRSLGARACDFVDLGVVCGLISAAGYGGADYLSQSAGRSVGVWRTSFYYYVLGVTVLSAWVVIQPEVLQRAAGAPSLAWLAAIASGLCLLTAVVLFTQGLIKGAIAVVAPITASYGAVTTLLSAIAGEHFSAWGIVGIVMIIMGACGVAIPAAGTGLASRPSGVGWAISAALAYGLGFWLQGIAVPMLGPLPPAWVVYASGLAIMGILQIFRVVDLALPSPASLLLPGLAASLLSIVGFFALTLGLSTGRVAIVVVLSSLTSGITVLLARFINRTRLAWHHWLAIAAILSGLGLIRA